MEKPNINHLNLMNHNDEAGFVQNHIQKTKSRLYVSWRNTQQKDCKMIGPETKCFCNHRYRQHQHELNKEQKSTKCNQKCSCKGFYYIPTHGAYDFKCLCKHSYKQHDPTKRNCKKQGCKCDTFKSTWSCSCGLKFGDHTTIVQTYLQRKQSGRNMGDMDRLVQQLNVGKQGLQKQEIHEQKIVSQFQKLNIKQEPIVKKQIKNPSTNPQTNNIKNISKKI